MYFVMYDRFLKSIGETYILESWSHVKRAVDFDDIKITGEQVPYSADPFLVVVNDRQGKLVFSGLASTPVMDDKSKKTSISLKDYATLFNTEILVNWSSFTGSTVAQYLNFILGLWKSQTDIGLPNIAWDTSYMIDVPLDPEIPLGEGTESVSVHTLVFDAINYYNLYYLTDLDLRSKTLTFSFRKANLRSVSVRLGDFDINSVEKSFGEYSRAVVYNYDYSVHSRWSLTMDNSIVKLPAEGADLVYPGKVRNFIADYEEPEGTVDNPAEEEQKKLDALYDALYDAIMGLAKNRYQENIDLNAQKYRSIVDLSEVDFSYTAAVYLADGFYKNLPVGEIETDSKGKHIVRLGYRIQELTQEI